jgi:hypothetical protein
LYLILTGFFCTTLILAYKTKYIEYTFLIIRSNLVFTEIKVKSNQKKDVEELVEQINEKLKGRSELFISDKLYYLIKK